MILNNGNYSKLKERFEYVSDIPNLENYLALYLCVKGIKEKDGNKQKKKIYLTSAEALRLMGLDVKECQKIDENSINYNGK